MVFASQKLLWSVPQTVFLHWSHSLLLFFGQVPVASDLVLWKVPPTVREHLSPSLLLRGIVDMSITHTVLQSAENPPIMSLLFGYSLGLNERNSISQKKRTRPFTTLQDLWKHRSRYHVGGRSPFVECGRSGLLMSLFLCSRESTGMECHGDPQFVSPAGGTG